MCIFVVQQSVCRIALKFFGDDFRWSVLSFSFLKATKPKKDKQDNAVRPIIQKIPAWTFPSGDFLCPP